MQLHCASPSSPSDAGLSDVAGVVESILTSMLDKLDVGPVSNGPGPKGPSTSSPIVVDLDDPDPDPGPFPDLKPGTPEDALLTCSVCRKRSHDTKSSAENDQSEQETPKKLKLLRCLHCICTDCMSTGYKLTAGVLSCRCAVCGMVSGEAAIVDNFLVAPLLNLAAATAGIQSGGTGSETDSGSSSNCSATGDKFCTCREQLPVEFSCAECNDLLCGKCAEAHQRVKLTQDHVLSQVANSGIAQPSSSSLIKLHSEPTCAKHPTELLQVFCKTCSELTCRDCQLSLHKDHSYELGKDVAPQKRRMLLEIKAMNLTRISNLQKSAELAETRKTETEQKRAEMKKAVRDAVTLLTNSIEERGRQLNEEIDSVCKSKSEIYEERKQTVAVISGLLSQANFVIEAALCSDSDLAILLAHQKVMRQIKETLDRRCDLNILQSPVNLRILLDNVGRMFENISSFGQLSIDRQFYPNSVGANLAPNVTLGSGSAPVPVPGGLGSGGQKQTQTQTGGSRLIAPPKVTAATASSQNVRFQISSRQPQFSTPNVSLSMQPVTATVSGNQRPPYLVGGQVPGHSGVPRPPSSTQQYSQAMHNSIPPPSQSFSQAMSAAAQLLSNSPTTRPQQLYMVSTGVATPPSGGTPPSGTLQASPWGPGRARQQSKALPLNGTSQSGSVNRGQLSGLGNQGKSLQTQGKQPSTPVALAPKPPQQGMPQISGVKSLATSVASTNAQLAALIHQQQRPMVTAPSMGILGNTQKPYGLVGAPIGIPSTSTTMRPSYSIAGAPMGTLRPSSSPGGTRPSSSPGVVSMGTPRPLSNLLGARPTHPPGLQQGAPRISQPQMTRMFVPQSQQQQVSSSGAYSPRFTNGGLQQLQVRGQQLQRLPTSQQQQQQLRFQSQPPPLQQAPRLAVQQRGSVQQGFGVGSRPRFGGQLTPGHADDEVQIISQRPPKPGDAPLVTGRSPAVRQGQCGQQQGPAIQRPVVPSLVAAPGLVPAPGLGSAPRPRSIDLFVNPVTNNNVNNSSINYSSTPAVSNNGTGAVPATTSTAATVSTLKSSAEACAEAFELETRRQSGGLLGEISHLPQLSTAVSTSQQQNEPISNGHVTETANGNSVPRLVLRMTKTGPVSNLKSPVHQRSINFDQHGVPYASPSDSVDSGQASVGSNQWDDFCGVCQNGGELVCCDGCPKVFHLNCHVPSLTAVPQGKWLCTFCDDPQKYLSDVDRQFRGQRRPAALQLTAFEAKLCERILIELFCHTDSGAFHEPVSSGLTQYHKVISHPMDFSTIKNSLIDGAYSGVEAFLGDLNLVFQNCASFNDDNSEIGLAGKAVGCLYKDLVGQYLPAYADCVNTEAPPVKSHTRKRRAVTPTVTPGATKRTSRSTGGGAGSGAGGSEMAADLATLEALAMLE